MSAILANAAGLKSSEPEAQGGQVSTIFTRTVPFGPYTFAYLPQFGLLLGLG